MVVQRRSSTAAKKAPAKKAAAQITAWSFSRYREYASEAGGCPRRAKYKFIDKLPEKESAVLARGSRIHKEAEDFVAGRVDELGGDLVLFKKEITQLRAAQAAVETESTFDKNWQLIRPTREQDRPWFSKDAWLRIKMDARYPTKNKLTIVDYKTGKTPEKQFDPRRGALNEMLHERQLELYGISGLIEYTKVKSVDAELWYVDHGDIYAKNYKREDLPKLIEAWTERVTPMLTDTTFKPAPSPLACQWCAFAKSKGGPCPEG